ncbi:MAG: hypothetical protein PHO46_03000 [Thermoguttaceae bacterium]|nr:hypothetical protein [Thermoguttaceae bacterium]
MLQLLLYLVDGQADDKRRSSSIELTKNTFRSMQKQNSAEIDHSA